MTNETAEKMRRAAKMPTPPVIWCSEAAVEIDRLEREKAELLEMLADYEHGGAAVTRSK